MISRWLSIYSSKEPVATFVTCRDPARKETRHWSTVGRSSCLDHGARKLPVLQRFRGDTTDFAEKQNKELFGNDLGKPKRGNPRSFPKVLCFFPQDPCCSAKSLHFKRTGQMCSTKPLC